MLQKELDVKEGIWIDEQWIRDAGLGRRLRVTIKPGEIRINPAKPEGEISGSLEGWAIFQTLGNDAQPGQLENAAVEHDRYLYGKGQ